MRQFACIELTPSDALLLRDAIRPLAPVHPFESGTAIGFCEKLYDGLLKVRAGGMETINVRLSEQEALLINHYVGCEDWQNALQLLEQTWLVLYELRHDRAYPRPAAATPAVVRQPEHPAPYAA